MTLIIVGAADPRRMEECVAEFERAGYARMRDLDDPKKSVGDAVLGVSGDGAELLRGADRRAIKYVLVHDGADDRQPGGTYERAHHRIQAAQRKELAEHLRTRDRPLVTCLAFGYKNGAPSNAALLIDARFLDNPYWVPELKDRSGLDAAVVDFVMKQPAATRIVSDVERMVRDLLPLYAEKGRMHLIVAFGCTGGRHRSVVLAAETARRLGDVEGIDVDLVTREL